MAMERARRGPELRHHTGRGPWTGAGRAPCRGVDRGSDDPGRGLRGAFHLRRRRAGLVRRVMTVLFWNGRTGQPVYAGMRFAVACGVLASSLTATACMVSVDSQALIEREEKRFTVKGTPVFCVSTFDGAT